VKVSLVDQCYPRRTAPEANGGVKPGEPTADDYDTMRVSHGLAGADSMPRKAIPGSSML
jgi:hypothetical protein